MNKTYIMSFIKGYKCTNRMSGIPLDKNSYDLYCIKKGEEYLLRTSLNSPLIEFLRRILNVTYKGAYYGHWHEFTLTKI